MKKIPMMETNKKGKIFFFLLMFFFLIPIWWGIQFFVLEKTEWYPLWIIESELFSADEKLGATYMLYVNYEDSKNSEVINVLIKNIDNFEIGKSIWEKQARLPVAYGIDAVLSKITKKNFGDFGDSHNKADWQEIADDWKNWYENEYLKWQEDMKKLSKASPKVQELYNQTCRIVIPDLIVISAPFDSEGDLESINKTILMQEYTLQKFKNIEQLIKEIPPEEIKLYSDVLGGINSKSIEWEIKNMKQAIKENNLMKEHWKSLELIFLVSDYLKKLENEKDDLLSLKKKIVEIYDNLSPSELKYFRGIYNDFEVDRLRNN